MHLSLSYHTLFLLMLRSHARLQLFSGLLNLFLFGILTVQVCTYTPNTTPHMLSDHTLSDIYVSSFPNDRKILKALGQTISLLPFIPASWFCTDWRTLH